MPNEARSGSLIPGAASRASASSKPGMCAMLAGRRGSSWVIVAAALLVLCFVALFAWTRNASHQPPAAPMHDSR